MGTTPVTTNPTVSVFDAILHALIFDVAVNAAVAAAIAEAPWLGFPIIRPVFTWLVGKFADQLYGVVEKNGSFAIISFQTDHEAAAYQGAVTDLKTAQQSGDAAKLQQAKIDFKKKLGDLIHYDGD